MEKIRWHRGQHMAAGDSTEVLGLSTWRQEPAYGTRQPHSEDRNFRKEQGNSMSSVRKKEEKGTVLSFHSRDSRKESHIFSR